MAAAFIYSAGAQTAQGASISGDIFQIDWRYPYPDTTIASIISAAPVAWDAGSGVTLALNEGQLVVRNSRLGWTGSEYIPFNGFVITDLTENPNFTSFTLVSVTGLSPPPWPPALNFDADHLIVNFIPGGVMNLGYADGSVYTFAFTTEVPEPTTLSLFTSALAALLLWKSAGRQREPDERRATEPRCFSQWRDGASVADCMPGARRA